MTRVHRLAAAMAAVFVFPFSPSFLSAQQINDATGFTTAVQGTQTDLNLQPGNEITFSGAASNSNSLRPAFNIIGNAGADHVPTVILNGNNDRILNVAGDVGSIAGIKVTGANGHTAISLGTGTNKHNGGAFYIGGQITGGISQSVFEGNQNYQSGSAGDRHRAILYANGLSGGINNSVFKDNEVYHSGAIFINGNFDGGITNSKFINNKTRANQDSVSAGALNVWENFTGNISGSLFEGNSSPSGTGGAIRIGYGLTGKLDGDIINTVFKNNSALNGGTGGAIGVIEEITGQIQNSEFSGNLAVNGRGGAIYTTGGIGKGIVNSTFENNESGGGGAIHLYGVLNGGISGSRFENNNATTTSGGAIVADTGMAGGVTGTTFKGNSSAGQGGAFFARTFSGGISNSTFESNTAQNDGGAVIFQQFSGGIANTTFSGNVSGSSGNFGGGAIAHLGTFYGGITDSKFIGNKAALSGGALFLNFFEDDITNSTFDQNEAGVKGGAVFFNNPLEGQILNSGFSANKVEGRAGQTEEGLGGAIFAPNDFALTGAAFTNNQAATQNAGDLTSGRGGAVFHDNRDTANPVNVSLSALTADRPVLFSGNTHNPGGGGVQNNSIYFGSTVADGSGTEMVTNLTVHTAAGSKVIMYDPMASQDPALVNGTNVQYNPVTVNVEKTGAGTWVMSGRTDMHGRGEWVIREGEIHLVSGPDQLTRAAVFDPVHINLTHPDSAFHLTNEARMVMTVANDKHLITAGHVRLDPGSSVGIIGPYNMPFLPRNIDPNQPIEVLGISCDGLLRHEQQVEQESGEMEVGLSNRAYRLYWGGENNTTLYLEFAAEELPDPQENLEPQPQDPQTPQQTRRPLTSARSRAAVSAVTAPGVITYYNRVGHRLFSRSRDILRDGNSIMLSNRLWATPYYGNVDQNSGGDRVGYDLNSYGGLIGFDHTFNLDTPVFVGTALNYNRGDYDSRDADLEGKQVEWLLYGGGVLPGEVELSAYGGLGWTDYDQHRRVGDFRYDTDFKSKHHRLGAELGRRFQMTEHFSLRPFLSYEYLNLRVDGYQEKFCYYSVDLDDFNQSIHEIKAGTSLTWTFSNNAYIDGRVYYSGVPSGRKAETSFDFNQNPGERFRTSGNDLVRNAGGFSLAGGVNLTENVNLNLGYELEKGSQTLAQQGRLTLSVAW